MASGLSLVTGCMNRTAMLLEVLPSWLALEELCQIIIVDWGSDEPIRSSSTLFEDKRIVVARAPDEKHWCAAKCHNLEFKLATTEAVLRVDADIFISSGFVVAHRPAPGAFHAGRCNHPRLLVGEALHTMGTVLVYKADWEAVGGYNENLIGYAHEDVDFYARLEATGLVRRQPQSSFLRHRPHDDIARLKHVILDDSVPEHVKNTPQLSNSPWVRGRFWTMNAVIQLNAYIALMKPWSSAEVRQSWAVEDISPNYRICRKAE